MSASAVVHRCGCVCVCVCVCVCAPRSGADAGDCEDGGQWVSKVVFSPDHGRVPLSDGDVVGGSLAVHAGHREPCGDKTQQSEHTRLQMPKRCGSPHEHLHGEQSTEKHGETQTKRWRAREIRGITGDWRNCDPARALLPFTDTHTHTHSLHWRSAAPFTRVPLSVVTTTACAPLFCGSHKSARPSTCKWRDSL